LTTKIFIAKNRLNGGGKILEALGVNNVYELEPIKMEALAESINSLVIRDYLKENQDGITDMEQTESWDYVKLFQKTIHYETSYLTNLEMEGIIGDKVKFAEEIAKPLYLLEFIVTRIVKYFIDLKPIKQEYFEDPDDPPVQRIGQTLYFVKCENYMTSFGIREFNLDYMLFKINYQTKYYDYNFAQNSLEETP
jgi:hypothetical protein